MADKVNIEHDATPTAIIIINKETGEEKRITEAALQSMTEAAIRETMSKGAGKLDEIIESCYTISTDYGNDGLVSIDLHPDGLDVLTDNIIPLVDEDGFSKIGLRPGRYYGLYTTLVNEDFTEEETAIYDITGDSNNGLLLVSSVDLIAGDGVSFIPVTIRPIDQHGNQYEGAPYDFIEAWIVEDDETGAFVTVNDLSNGVFVMSSLQLAVETGLYKRKPRRARKNSYTSPTQAVKWPNDPISLAVMGKNAGHIEPFDYFNNEGRVIQTGNGGTAKITIKPSDDIEITADERLYVLDDEANFWITMLSSIAVDTGENEIYGSELLKLAGYKNPYRDDSAKVMESAAKNIFKAMRTYIAVDTTEERRNKRRKNRETIESFGLRPVVSASIDFTKEVIKDDNGEDVDEIVKDFIVTLNADKDDIISAFPLYKYANSRDMILTVGKNEYTFDGLKLSLDDRRMWMYIMRRIKSKKLSNTIKFSTMWETLNFRPREYKAPEKLDENGKPLKDEKGNSLYEQEDKNIIARKQSEAMRLKKHRMIKQLEKMLYQASGGLRNGEKMKGGNTPKYPQRIASWDWTKDNSGRVDGVKITPLKNTT